MIAGEILFVSIALIILSFFFFLLNNIIHKPANKKMKRYVEKYYKEIDNVSDQA